MTMMMATTFIKAVAKVFLRAILSRIQKNSFSPWVLYVFANSLLQTAIIFLFTSISSLSREQTKKYKQRSKQTEKVDRNYYQLNASNFSSSFLVLLVNYLNDL